MNVLATALIDILLSLPQATVFLLYAIGIVVIYRASRVLNLAHGVMAMAPAYVYYSLSQTLLPPPLAALLAVIFGAALGIATERLVVRRLRTQGPTAQTVGTVAVFGLGVAVVAKLFGTAPLVTKPLFPTGSIPIGLTGLSYGQILVFIIGLALAAAMFALFRFTGIGLAMRGSADNRRGALMMGVDVERTTMLAWGLGGGLAAVAGVFVGSLTNIHPYTLSFQVLPAFVAALLGGLESLPGTVWGSLVVGLAQGEVPALSLVPGIGSFASSVGFPNLVLMVLSFIVMGFRGARLVGSRVRDEALGAVASVRQSRPSPAMKPIALIAALVVGTFPFLPFVPFSFLSDGVLAAFYLTVALSLVLLTGWVGQISLAQAEFVGVGAFLTALLANRFGIGFPYSFFIATLAGGLIAAALGLVALRVRGLYLAVATLVFAAMADNFLFNADWFANSGSVTMAVGAVGPNTALPHLDFADIRLIYLLFVALAVFCIYALANLSQTKTGRAFFAVRGSEVAAASLGIDVTRYKLLAFLLAGMIAGAAGNLYMVWLRAVVSDSFTVLVSLFFVSVAVVGGLLSLGGAVVAALLFAALQEVFFRVPQLAGLLNIVSSGLLLTVLLVYPGGLAALPGRISDFGAKLFNLPVPKLKVPQMLWISGKRRLRLPAFRGPTRTPQPGRKGPESDSLARLTLQDPSNPSTVSLGNGHGQVEAKAHWETFVPAKRLAEAQARPEAVVLGARGVTVRFGGLIAVNEVTLEVRAGEIVGLIGANGAGKTTLFNVISGLVEPVQGQVELFARRVSRLQVHERASLGVARTFQDIQLFPQLSVFDNLLVATHLRNQSNLVQNVLVTSRGLRAEVNARERVRKVLTFLGLRELADRPIRDLSFGQLRLIEVARALVTGPELVLLDEPASGLDNHESDRLVQLLLYVREELGISMLVVEHDVQTVVELSDYMYVLDQGRLISEGRPHYVQRDQAVITAYLGEPIATEVGA